MDNTRFKQSKINYPQSNRNWKTRRSNSYNNSIQDKFLQLCVKNGTEVQVHLKNDSVKKGFIRGFDNWTLIISENDDNIIMLFKSAVTAITPIETLFWQTLEHNAVFSNVSEPRSIYDHYYH
ncbi:MAG: RNA chaperone Hfq [Fastidiosipilaceae bacterium]|jgi:host factor-I protein|nr:hypothetical protein [Clostridiaceae bacterium]